VDISVLTGGEWRTQRAESIPTAERYENPGSDPGRPEGLLIKGRRAIYENTLLSFEGNPHAHWFTGSITCEHIDGLALEYYDIEARGG
jgi:hypothetical protein